MAIGRLRLSQADLSRGHFTVLLGAMLLFLFVLSPISKSFPVLHLLLDLFFVFILAWSCYTISDDRRTFLRGMSLFAVAIVAGVVGSLSEHLQLSVVSMACTGLFCTFMAFTILGRVLEQRDVTLDAVFGGVCAYLFLGLLWASAYAAINAFDPNAFAISEALIAKAEPTALRPGALFVYFSFVTLTTLGYGDMSPLHEVARSLVVLEAVVGPFYMAILIGWLVGRARPAGETADS